MKNAIFLFLFYTVAINAQTKESIINTGNYYYGEATAEQEQEAVDKARQRLIEQISINVSSMKEWDQSEKSGNIQDTYRSIVNTYSNSTLKNVRMLKSQTNRGIEVFCYVSKSEVERSFEERKQLVCEIY
jgi:hypothetical protein